MSKKTKTQIHKYYFDNPDLWDGLRSRKVSKEVEFLKKIFKRYPHIKSVLDIGCGTGLHTKALHDLGYSITGLDLNPSITNYARKKYPDLNFILGDMQKLPQLKLPQYDAIICLCTTFSYNTSHSQVNKVLQDFNKLLKPGGLIIIEVFNPISFLEKFQFKGSFFMENPDDFAKMGLRIEVLHKLNEGKQLITEYKKFYSLHGDLLAQNTTKFKMFFPQELRLYCQLNGFKVIGQWGRYNINYTSLDRSRFITVAQKI